MPNFEILNGEYVIREGMMAYIKSPINAQVCDCTLTTQRLVACSKQFWLWGLFSFLFASKSVAFDIPLATVRSIVKEKHGLGEKYIISSTTGLHVAVQFNSSIDQWIEVITRAVQEASQNVVVRKNGDTIEFIRGSEP